MATEKRLTAFDPITFESFTRHATKHREPDSCQYDMGYVDAVDQIGDWLDANTVDAVEVVRGRWKKLPYHPYRCSRCDEIAPLDQSGEFHYTSNYCPNCGADMRERKDND